MEQRMLNPEFAELVKVGKAYFNGQANKNLDVAVMENCARILALKAMQIINELKRNWTDDSIDYWKALRELCLMRPTLSRKNVEYNSQYQLVYMCAPGEITSYSYEQEGDYNNNINIKFDGSLPQKMSEDEVHLKEIMQNPGVKELFEKHGYATSFVPNEFILTPPMFNNIYKGALGEVVGKYILEQYAGVTLQEMSPEHFELFDYTLGNGVYVDFKLWKETMTVSAEEEKKNIQAKLDKCGGKRAVIINIMLDHNMQITSSDHGRIIEIQAELDIVIPHIDVNTEYTKSDIMGLFKGIATKKEVVRYVFENTGSMLYSYLRGEEERREYLSGNIDINYFDYDDTYAKYSVGEIGNGMKYTIERASVVREIQAVEGGKLIFKKLLPLMGVEFVRYGMLTVVPFPFKYLREYIVKKEQL